MRITSLLVATLIVAGSAFAASWQTDSYRTRSGSLVRPGMNMTEVLAEAGEPANRRVVSTGINLGDRRGETVEVWTYRGYDGYYDVTFTGNHVTAIEVTADR
jgi:hypothetical protein